MPGLSDSSLRDRVFYQSKSIDPHNLVLGRSLNALHLIQAVIDPERDLVLRGLVGGDISAEQVLPGVGPALRHGQDVMDVPATVDSGGKIEPPGISVDHIIIRITVCFAAHQAPVKIDRKPLSTIALFPETQGACAIYFHFSHLRSGP